jgi:hypothetical protein
VLSPPVVSTARVAGCYQNGRPRGACRAGTILAAPAWHAATHLTMDPHAFVSGLLSLIGFVVALAALGVDRRRRRAALATPGDRRAA